MATPLFTADDLNGLLGVDVTDARATSVERVIWGWIKPLLGVDDRPYPLDDTLFAWAIELGAIVLENPTGKIQKSTGPWTSVYAGRSGSATARREEILHEIASSSLGAGGLRPRGNFPPAHRYPDPSRAKPGPVYLE